MQETILIEISILACEEFIKTLLHEGTHRTKSKFSASNVDKGLFSIETA
jgi:hypothetical protein